MQWRHGQPSFVIFLGNIVYEFSIDFESGRQTICNLRAKGYKISKSGNRIKNKQPSKQGRCQGS